MSTCQRSRSHFGNIVKKLSRSMGFRLCASLPERHVGNEPNGFRKLIHTFPVIRVSNISQRTRSQTGRVQRGIQRLIRGERWGMAELCQERKRSASFLKISHFHPRRLGAHAFMWRWNDREINLHHNTNEKENRSANGGVLIIKIRSWACCHHEEPPSSSASARSWTHQKR